MEAELKKIKKIYGENFAKLCRSHFSTILENEGRLLDFLTKNIAPSRSFYEDLVEQGQVDNFKDFVYSYLGDIKVETDIEETPEELFEKAGYTLIKCETDVDVKKFMKYYEENERLCTFKDSNRINTHTIFFAVKKNVANIKRAEFPRRQDEYGTSVISLQFSKSGNYLSIKNRYNHTVDNPDATFSNDLENIYPGLTDSFKKYYGLEYRNSQSKFELKGYVKASDGKYYKYNCEINGSYLCENNIVIYHGEVKSYDKMKFELVDNFLIDLEHKTIQEYGGEPREVEKIEIVKTENNCRKITITNKDGTNIVMTVSKSNTLVSYEDNLTVKGDKEFLRYSENLQEVSLMALEDAGDQFLENATRITQLNAPNLTTVGDLFLRCNLGLQELDLPSLEVAGDSFMFYNRSISRVNLPKLRKVGHGFLSDNANLTELNLPSLEVAGNSFMYYRNHDLTSVNLPKLRVVGSSFLYANTELKELHLPSLEEVRECFLSNNKGLKSLALPKLRKAGYDFLAKNQELTELSLPELEQVEHGFIYLNNLISELSLPKLKKVGSSFLRSNKELSEISLPSLETIDSGFIEHNRKIVKVDLPMVKSIHEGFLKNNESVTKLCLPRLEYIGDNFMNYNRSLTKIDLPKVKSIGSKFLSASCLEELYIPQLEAVGTQFLGLDSDFKTSIKSMFIVNSRLSNLKRIDITRLKSLPPELKKLIIEQSKSVGL